jgi:L-fuconolactonase
MIDAHHHLWNLDRVALPWLTAEHAAIAGPFEPEDLEPLLAAAGIERTVIVQSGCLDADTDSMFSIAASRPWIAAVVAWAPLASPDDCRSRLDELQREPKLRGIRHLIHDEADPHWIVRPTVLESLALLEDRDLILELPVVFPRHFDDVLELARSFPRLSIVIDHLGKPPLGTGEMEAWERMLRASAAFDNVSAKLSGLNTMIGRADWDADDLRRPTEVAVDCFGPDRLVAGSDWPVSLLNGSYTKVWEATMRVVHEVAPDGADRILGGTARTLYRLDDTHRPDLLPRGEELHGRAD